MSKKTINIAYFTADWNRELVSIALAAVDAYLEKRSDVHVHVFDCFTSALYLKKSAPRYQIYDLPDLKQYDAVMVQTHEIEDNKVIRKLEERIVEAGIPAVSVGVEMKGCTYIGTDDYHASREIAEHLITVHGAKSFLYLKGCEREGEGEAEARRHGFEDVCAEHGIPKEQIMYYSGEWESRRGRQAVEEWLSQGRPLPDAIVSANDEMALGAMGALAEAGMHIPDDVLVTGYDGIFSATLSDPRLTTISRSFPTLITNGIELLISALEGREAPAVFYSPYQLSCWGSCGCDEAAMQELPKIRRNYFVHARELEKIYFQQDKLTAALFSASPTGLLDAMESNYRVFSEGKLYIYFNASYFDHFIDSDEESGIHGSGYSDTLVLTGCAGHSLGCDAKHAYMRVPRNELIRAPFIRDEKLVIFYPLQFEDINLGFMVLTRPPSVDGMHLHEGIINLFLFAMENARQRSRSERLNSTLNALYMTDPLTGLYNRFGYEKLAESVLTGIDQRGGRLHVLFLDIDDMKYINDRFGHEQGDLAIQTVSDVINKSCRRSDFKMRYGGDEFVILTESGDVDLKDRLAGNFDRLNEDHLLPFRLEVSIGEYVAEDGDLDTLDEMLRRADEKMYQEKQRKKD